MKKLSKNKIAKTYAEALYEAAVDKNSVEAVFADVQKLQEMISEKPEIVSMLANPLWNALSKVKTLAEVAEKTGLHNETLECLDIIAENGRFADLSEIMTAFIHIYYAKHDIAEVQVVSTQALSDEQKDRLQQKMEKKLNRKVLLHNEIDTRILGGLRIVYGSEMIDASLEDKLNRLEIAMKGGL